MVKGGAGCCKEEKGTRTVRRRSPVGTEPKISILGEDSLLSLVRRDICRSGTGKQKMGRKMLTSLVISILLLWLRTDHIMITKKDSRIKKTTGKLKDIE